MRSIKLGEDYTDTTTIHVFNQRTDMSEDVSGKNWEALC